MPPPPDSKSFLGRRELLVTLIHDGEITAHVRFQGGAKETLHLPRPLSAWELRQTSAEVLDAIDRLLNDYTEGQIAEQLNQQGLRSGMGSTFTGRLVGQIRRSHQIPTRYDRLRKAGMLTQAEIAKLLDIHPSTVRAWRDRGLLTAHIYNDKNQCLYERPQKSMPIKHQGIKLTDPRRFATVTPDRADEVQVET